MDLKPNEPTINLQKMKKSAIRSWTFTLLTAAICSWTINSYGQGALTCGTAQVITPGAQTCDAITGTYEAFSTCTGYGPSVARWYAYTPAGDGAVSVLSCGVAGGVDTEVSIGTGVCGSLSMEACNDDCLSSLESEIIFPVTGGTTYYIQWDDGWDPSPFNWELAFFPPPPGEDCATAAGPLSIANTVGSCSYTTITSGFTQDGPGASCSAGDGAIPDDDIWYSFVAPSPANKKIIITTTAGTSDDWVMEVWDDCPGSGSAIACNDDANVLMPEIELCQFAYTPGATYYVRAWTWDAGGSGSTMDICIYKDNACPAPPANDNCSSATTLVMGADATWCPSNELVGTTIDATSGAEGSTTCDLFGTLNDVWYVLTTGASQTLMDVTITNTNGTQQWAIYEGVPCGGGGSELDCGVATATSTLGVLPSTDYYVRIYANPGNEGDFTVCAYDVPPLPGEDCATAAGPLAIAANIGACSYTTVTSGNSQNGPQTGCSTGEGATPDDDIWYFFVAPDPAINNVVITTVAGSFNDWVMEIWDDCPGSGSVVACNDDTNGLMPEIELCQFSYTAGATYYIRAWTWDVGGSGSTMDICIYEDTPCPTPPTNDDCGSAISMTIGPDASWCPSMETSGTTTNATPGAEGTTTCDQFGTLNDVWYVVSTSATQNGLEVLFNTLSGIQEWSIYEGAPCGGGGTEVDCGAVLGTSTLTVLPSTDYYIRAHANPGFEGGFTICAYEICGAIVDCNGDCGGSAAVDNCGICAGGNTGLVPNADEDCNGDCFGTAFIDACFTCVGGNTGLLPCTPSCTEIMELTINTDDMGSETTWEIVNHIGSVQEAAGGPYVNTPGGTTEVEFACLPIGCYDLFVYDSFGDGIIGGGYVLTDDQNRRVIDNSLNGDGFTNTSTIANGIGWCVPIETNALLSNNSVPYTGCDKLTYAPNDFFIAEPVAAVNPANGDGYQFWMFDPNGTYSRRTFQTNGVYNGWSDTDPNDACYLRFGWLNTLPVPQDLILNVRVRAKISSVYQEFGSVCLAMVHDVSGDPCTTTLLVDDPNNPNYSCDVALEFGGSDKVVAYPLVGVNKYRFRFADQNSAFARNIAGASNARILNWFTNPLTDGATYDVSVAVSYDGGASYCPFGPSCPITIANPPSAQGRDLITSNEFSINIYPNPNRGQNVYLNMEHIQGDVDKIQIDLFDSYGKVVHRETVYQPGDDVNMILKLDNDLSDGVYVISVQFGDEVYTEMLVVQ